jgi:iron complex outermembrane receptor protein
MALNGKVTRDLQLGVSATAIGTRQSGTGDPTMDGKREADVPSFKSNVYANYSVPQVAGLKLDADWQYSSRKAFDKANTVFVGSYHVLNLGGSYDTKMGGTSVTLRAQVDNALNKFYWRDVTPELGGYLFPGAKRTFRVSATFDL